MVPEADDKGLYKPRKTMRLQLVVHRSSLLPFASIRATAKEKGCQKKTTVICKLFALGKK
jgi:hypothetical protein